MGYKFSNWNAINARHHIQLKFGKLISIRTVIRLFHGQHLKLKRPRARPAKVNVEKQQIFFDTLRSSLIHASKTDRFFFFDACSVQRSATLTRMWWDEGSQPEIQVCGGRERLHILGVLDFTGNTGKFTFHNRLKAQEFIKFLEMLLKEYPREKLHIICDNAKAHHAKIVQKFVTERKERLELIFLPPYSPRLNPIERFWQFLRQEVTHNTFFDTFTAFQRDITEFLQGFSNPNNKIRDLCAIYRGNKPISVASL
jgi:transposase